MFLKAQVSSFIATASDFLVTIFLREIAGLWYLPASVLGTITGGVVNYFINRTWSFGSRPDTKDIQDTIGSQAFRYFHIWAGSIILNASGMWLLTSPGGINYIVSKLIVSFAVGIGFNYPLQKRYVFRKKFKKKDAVTI
jgi:putative flippase GtrA